MSCTTIDWFSVWPADALKSVANKFLPQLGSPDDEDGVQQGGVSVGGGSALRCAVEDTCMLFHTSIRKLAEDYRRCVWAQWQFGAASLSLPFEQACRTAVQQRVPAAV